MNHQIYVDWGRHKVSLTWQPFKNMTQSEIVTSVHSYCFYQGKVLLVKVKERGFNIPGGHIEVGESPEEAIHREVYEEGYVMGQLK